MITLFTGDVEICLISTSESHKFRFTDCEVIDADTFFAVVEHFADSGKTATNIFMKHRIEYVSIILKYSVYSPVEIIRLGKRACNPLEKSVYFSALIFLGFAENEERIGSY